MPDPVDERVALSHACRAYLNTEIRDPLLITKVLGVFVAADALLEALRDDDA